MAVIGGLGSIPGALLGAVYVRGVDYYFAQEWQILATGVGLLVVLMLLPGGIGGGLADLRDALLRRVARRRGLDDRQPRARRTRRARRRSRAQSPAHRQCRRPRWRCAGSSSRTTARRVLHGVDLVVGEGEVVALLGTNGAGKSTVLRAIAGLAPIAAGTVLLDGRRRDRSSPGCRLPSLGVAERARVTPARSRASPFASTSDSPRGRTDGDPDGDARRRRARSLEHFPELRERLAGRAGDLSGGQQQMLNLAMALIARPRVLLLDELSLGLAPVVVERLLAVVRELAAVGNDDAARRAVGAARARGRGTRLLPRAGRRALRGPDPRAPRSPRPRPSRLPRPCGAAPRRLPGTLDAEAARLERAEDPRARARCASRCTTCRSASAGSSRSTTSRSTCTTARSSASSDPTAPGRRRSSTCSAGSSTPTPARSRSAANGTREELGGRSTGVTRAGRTRALVPGRPPLPGAHGRRGARGRVRGPRRGARPGRSGAAPSRGRRDRKPQSDARVDELLERVRARRPSRRVRARALDGHAPDPRSCVRGRRRARASSSSTSRRPGLAGAEQDAMAPLLRRLRDERGIDARRHRARPRRCSRPSPTASSRSTWARSSPTVAPTTSSATRPWSRPTSGARRDAHARRRRPRAARRPLPPRDRRRRRRSSSPGSSRAGAPTRAAPGGRGPLRARSRSRSTRRRPAASRSTGARRATRPEGPSRCRSGTRRRASSPGTAATTAARRTPASPATRSSSPSTRSSPTCSSRRSSSAAAATRRSARSSRRSSSTSTSSRRTTRPTGARSASCP